MASSFVWGDGRVWLVGQMMMLAECWDNMISCRTRELNPSEESACDPSCRRHAVIIVIGMCLL